jgi:hypothetical protein
MKLQKVEAKKKLIFYDENFYKSKIKWGRSKRSHEKGHEVAHSSRT